MSRSDNVDSFITCVVCCPCISFHIIYNMCYNDLIFINEICEKVFEKDLISGFLIGKKMTSLNKNWLYLSIKKKEKLTKLLYKIIKSQLSESKINIDKIKDSYSGRNFIVNQIRWFLKMSIINNYNNNDKAKWNPNSNNFEIKELKSQFIGWEEAEMNESDAKEFIDKFLVIDSINEKYELNTNKDDEIMTLNVKYEYLLNEIIEKENDYVTIFERSNKYLQELDEDRKRNEIIAEKRNRASIHPDEII